MVDDDVKEEVMDLKEHKDECLNLDEDITPPEEQIIKVLPVYPNHAPMVITLIDEVREDGLGSKKRKVRMEDVGHFIQKWARLDSIDMLISNKRVWTWFVNYRAYSGDSVGKYGVNLLRFDLTDTLPMKEKVWTSRVKFRAFVGNVVGKCSLQPP